MEPQHCAMGQPLEGPARAEMRPVLGEGEAWPRQLTPLPQLGTLRSFILLASRTTGNGVRGVSSFWIFIISQPLSSIHFFHALILSTCYLGSKDGHLGTCTRRLGRP